MRSIGGAVFKDNPLTGEERNNLWTVLGVPMFSTSAIPDWVVRDNLIDFEETGVFVFVALAKSIKRGKGCG